VLWSPLVLLSVVALGTCKSALEIAQVGVLALSVLLWALETVLMVEMLLFVLETQLAHRVLVVPWQSRLVVVARLRPVSCPFGLQTRFPLVLPAQWFSVVVPLELGTLAG